MTLSGALESGGKEMTGALLFGLAMRWGDVPGSSEG